MSLTQHIALLGSGNMAGALIEGLLASGTCEPAQINACDVRPEALEALASRHGVGTTTDNRAAAAAADVLVLSTKPQVFPALLAEIADSVKDGAVVISIAAGVPISVIEGQLNGEAHVVRAMPNTPALVQTGATGIAPGSHASDADMAVAASIFESIGVVVRVPESLIDAVTGLSGSGPAYVFAMIEAMVEGGVRVGLSPADALTLASQTVLGAARLLIDSGESAATLRARVSSPGGTTVAGLARLDELKFGEAMVAAIERATERAGELGAEAAANSKD